MRNKNKKGLAMFGYVVFIVIALVTASVIIAFILRFTEGLDEREAAQLCKTTVAARAATAGQVEGLTSVKAFPPVCQTIDKEISGNRQEAQLNLADHMVQCWQMMGEGRYDTNIFENLDFMDDNLCFMCYSILLDEHRDFKKGLPGDGTGISKNEFDDFLAKQERIKGQSYLDYFQFGEGTGSVILGLTDEGIKPGRAYAVVFKARDKSACQLDVCNAFNKIGYQAKSDAIALVDLADAEISELLAKHCEFVPGVAGS